MYSMSNIFGLPNMIYLANDCAAKRFGSDSFLIFRHTYVYRESAFAWFIGGILSRMSIKGIYIWFWWWSHRDWNACPFCWANRHVTEYFSALGMMIWVISRGRSPIMRGFAMQSIRIDLRDGCLDRVYDYRVIKIGVEMVRMHFSTS